MTPEYIEGLKKRREKLEKYMDGKIRIEGDPQNVAYFTAILNDLIGYLSALP